MIYRYNLNSHKEVLSYDYIDEKQVYNSFKEFQMLKQDRFLNFSALILNIHKYQNFVKFYKILYVESLDKLES